MGKQVTGLRIPADHQLYAVRMVIAIPDYGCDKPIDPSLYVDLMDEEAIMLSLDTDRLEIVLPCEEVSE